MFFLTTTRTSPSTTTSGTTLNTGFYGQPAPRTRGSQPIVYYGSGFVKRRLGWVFRCWPLPGKLLCRLTQPSMYRPATASAIA